MNVYVAFLRGINVGGNSLIKMDQLKDALSADGLSDVKTYIQSGNVIFSSGVSDTGILSKSIRSSIRKNFDLAVDIAVFTQAEWRRIIESAPEWWGADPDWKHNLLIMIEPFKMEDVVLVMGESRPGIETIEPGDGVVYQSVSIRKFGSSSAKRLVADPVYKKLTIRNFNTATKLQALLAEYSQAHLMTGNQEMEGSDD